MDYLIELIIDLIVQVLVQFVFELLVEGALRGVARALTFPLGRTLVMMGAGLVFGIVWGSHLSHRASPPRLLWVSLVLGAVAAAAAARNRHRAAAEVGRPGSFDWRQLIAPPWRWPSRRLIDFVALNAAIAAGIVIGYSQH